MRDHDDPFCAVCARQIVPTMYRNVVRESIRRRARSRRCPASGDLDARRGAARSGRGDAAFLLLYDAVGRRLRAARRLPDDRRLSERDRGRREIERDLTCFVPTIFAGQLELTAYRFAPSARIQYRIGPTLAPLQKIREDGFPLPVPTHGVLVTRGADQLVLSYNRLDRRGRAGAARARRQTPTIVAAEQWELNWSTVAPLRGWAESFVFCYEWRSGNYAIRALPATFGGAPAPVWSSPGNVFPLVRQMTHALSLAHGTGVFVVGYWALTGMGSVYALRAVGAGSTSWPGSSSTPGPR